MKKGIFGKITFFITKFINFRIVTLNRLLQRNACFNLFLNIKKKYINNIRPQPQLFNFYYDEHYQVDYRLKKSY